MNKSILFSFTFISILLSCSKSSHPIYDVLGDVHIDSGNKVFMVIPVFNGCHTCIEESLIYFEERQNNPDLIAVLAYSDLKSNSSMRVRINSLGIELNYGDNVVLDSTNLSFKNELITMNPSVYFYRDGDLSLLVLKPLTIVEGFKYIDKFLGIKN